MLGSMQADISLYRKETETFIKIGIPKKNIGIQVSVGVPAISW